MTTLYLASGSPRRAELLTQLGYTFEIVKPNIPEQQQVGEAPQHYVARLAREKAQAGLALAQSQAVVLGSDTLLQLDEQVLEKPLDQNHFEQMFTQLSGRTHQVLTAVAVTDGEQTRELVVCTEVTFKTLQQPEILRYWATGEPQDKAGGYGIQGIGGRFVTHINGSYFAVVGLPLYETDSLLQQFNLSSTFGSSM